MPTTEENYKLLWGIIVQKMNNGVLEGIDWAQIGEHLGIDKPNTVSKRFTYLKEEFNKLGFPSAAKVSAKGRAPKAAAKPKTANPKARAAVTKAKTPTKGKGKKSKAVVEDEEEDDDLGQGSAMDEDVDVKSDVDVDLDVLSENGGSGYQEIEHQDDEEEA